MNSRRNVGFSSRRPLPTINEAPSTSQPSTSPNTNPHTSNSSVSSSLERNSSGGTYGSAPFARTKSSPNTQSRPNASGRTASSPLLSTPMVKPRPRTSKTSQKHVQLPTAAQDAPLPAILESPDRLRIRSDGEDDANEFGTPIGEGEEEWGGERDGEERRGRHFGVKGSHPSGQGMGVVEDDIWKRTLGETLTPEQRDQMGYQRLTAYYCADELRMSLLSTFLKREHAVSPRLYDDAIYALYHLPLLPGYQPNVNIRSCITDKAAQAKLVLSLITEAEESGYNEAYFPSSVLANVSTGSGTTTPVNRDGFIDTAIPPAANLNTLLASKALHRDHGTFSTQRDPGIRSSPALSSHAKRRFPRAHIAQRRLLGVEDHPVAEAIFFRYGVVVFFGFTQHNELDILDDLIKQGVMIGEKKSGEKKQYEIESFHFEYDPAAPTPRIYNDFFTFKSPSHLLKLAIAHAIAQSTVLSTHETASSNLLSSPLTQSILTQLTTSGIIKMKRRVALRLTGQLFQMRQNVNLSSNVLDVPELFWSEASLKGLYDAVREYLEVDKRVKSLNEKLAGIGDLLDVIHDHLNNDAMERITLIIIW
ncbi:related to RMD8-Cytosolic protein required for sporulation [Serendipita indica DSM 11827]|uniref:Related to RMD8-Cytosolic protein required for sporulation n=1 Tax=Serendipita indica (strain DSM 11827) TaxID=1109443 RepID=G4TV17_SERID|nr:related to RMD8-Cytosolic protein required for sporulation [Serendipita indica DSM 11827]